MSDSKQTVRFTSVTVTHRTNDAGIAHAEDMHQFPCFIDAASQIDAEPKPGMILNAEIDQAGRVVKAFTPGKR